MAAPRPGIPVRGSRTGRPIMALFDLLERRWVLRILWELRTQRLGFRELQRQCGTLSPSVLALRLRELTEAGILAADSGKYALTAEGRRLARALAPLTAWAERWGKRTRRAGGRA